MQQLQDIAVRVEAMESAELNHSNALPIMHEILHALQRFRKEDKGATIDLQSIPFGPGDEEELLHLLGRGEVSIALQSLGESSIWETAYPGVWLIDHQNAEGERIALQIEINRVPEIVPSQTEDISDAITRLSMQLSPNAAESRQREEK
ncbi:MAG: hydrogenase expression/formation protein [Candidatus Thiodiazotropha sp. (ex Epidulcina cf. delphinae)]|nr:hydrogenase expression/formation protein [Candidatus Thiodiazotropha sp. (ex Epidulcina cf. delphinae)]